MVLYIMKYKNKVLRRNLYGIEKNLDENVGKCQGSMAM